MKELLTRLTIRSLCIMSVISVISHFGFEGGILVLIAPIPVHLLLVTSFCDGRGFSGHQSKI